MNSVKCSINNVSKYNKLKMFRENCFIIIRKINLKLKKFYIASSYLGGLSAGKEEVARLRNSTAVFAISVIVLAVVMFELLV